MTTPAIITVAITGAIPTTADNPAVPVEPTTQIASAVEAFDAGARVCHVHVRDEEQRASSDPALYRQVQDGIKAQRPDMIVQFSTGARGRRQDERFACLEHRPEMASLSTGTVNFPKGIYENPPDLVEYAAKAMLDRRIKPEIEVFDLAMLYTAADLADRGLLQMPLHVQLVLGVRNALPAREEIVDFFAAELHRVLPGATWTCAAIGRRQLDANRWSLERGGHVRTGLEDNLYYNKGELASSNAQLVTRLAQLCIEYERHPASPQEARQILGIPG
ncbi:BKACE family enzyme [Rhodococcus opacus]|uniref:3-keto-5-aminohexanoate cleavage protein n=1 Tax=Rhodococcus opacus TaxID=37919 RepID=UPI00294A5285|nr:3-keto-5-aminohexanoate cleavage protein [Rhodococcus opacus]MDV6247085.1 3-keto-5-aminohexanoate cleavage protein [Rhodococcus opacus]